MIYFLRNGDRGPVKIGRTNDIESRLYELRRTYGAPLSPIRIIYDYSGVLMERWMHRRFVENHIRGEWFEYHEDMLTVELPSYEDIRYAPDETFKRLTFQRKGPSGDYHEHIRRLLAA